MADLSLVPSSPPPPHVPPIQERLCAATAASLDHDPIGTAPHVGRLLAVEMATPWTRAGADPDPAGSIPEQIMAAQRTARSASEVKAEHGGARIYGFAPDPEWSTPGEHRALLARRRDRDTAGYEVHEYRFPGQDGSLVDFACAFLVDPARVGEFDDYRVERPNVVDLLVCTHGRRDACCAKFGMPLYRKARGRYPSIRAWRTMHFGGHRYAPTAWEFPSGYMWGFLDEAASDALLERGSPELLTRHVRGWRGVPRAVQPLDRIGLLEYGWAWQEFERSGVVVDSDDDGWQVRLEFDAGTGERGAYEGVTRVGRRLPAVGCGAEWGTRESLVDELELEPYWSVARTGSVA